LREANGKHIEVYKWINNTACRLKQKYLDKITPDVSGVLRTYELYLKKSKE